MRWAAWTLASLFLLLLDGYWGLAQPVRTGFSAALAPIQTLGTSPVRWVQGLGQHFADLSQAQSRADQASKALANMGLQKAELTQLREENARLHQLLQLRGQRYAPGIAVEIVFATSDPYSRKVLINKGRAQGIQRGSPVLGAQGVLGQVTQVYWQSAEVSLLTGQNFTIPVRNQRTQAISVAYGLPAVGGGWLELKHLPSNADVQVGDILTTNGMDGVYPPSLTVATVTQVERRTSTTFARIYAQPLAQMGATYALVLPPVGLPDIDPEALTQLQPKPTPSTRDARSKAKAPAKSPTRTVNPANTAPHTPPPGGAQP